MATRDEEKRKRGTAKPVVTARQIIGAIPPIETPTYSRRKVGASGSHKVFDLSDIPTTQSTGTIATGPRPRQAPAGAQTTLGSLFRGGLDARTTDVNANRQAVANAVEPILPAAGGGISEFGQDLYRSAMNLGNRMVPSFFGGGGQNVVTALGGATLGETGPVRAAVNIIDRATEPPQMSNQGGPVSQLSQIASRGNFPKERNPASEPPVVVSGARAPQAVGDQPQVSQYERIGGDQYRATVPEVTGEAILSRAPVGGTFSVAQGRTADEQALIDQRIAQIDSQADALYRTRMARRGKRVEPRNAVTPETQQQLIIEREKGNQRRLVEQERAKAQSGDRTTTVTRQLQPQITPSGEIVVGSNVFDPPQYQQFMSGIGNIEFTDADGNIIGQIPTINQQVLNQAADPDMVEAARLDLMELFGLTDPTQEDILAYLRREIENNMFTDRQVTRISR